MKRYAYEVIVEDDDGSCTATVAGEPFSGHGTSPIEALRELVACLADWQQGGSERWLATPAGVQLARQFVPSFEPGRTGGAA